MVISLERGADLHMAQLLPLPLTVSCFSKIQIGFTFLVPARPGSPGQRAVKRVCVLCCVWSVRRRKRGACHLRLPSTHEPGAVVQQGRRADSVGEGFGRLVGGRHRQQSEGPNSRQVHHRQTQVGTELLLTTTQQPPFHGSTCVTTDSPAGVLSARMARWSCVSSAYW